MPQITDIIHKPDKERFWVYVDGVFCCSIRERTFNAINLTIGQNISCERVQDLEKFHWKNVYGKQAWNKEKIRLKKVKDMIEEIDARIQANIVGFGANSNEYIKNHPDEKGKPDIEVILKENVNLILLLIEVSGTEMMRSMSPGIPSYWVRPDKLNYAKNHPEQDIWFIMHYANPEEKFVFIKPDNNKNYPYKKRDIRGSIEHYVEFSDMMPECISKHDFVLYLKSKIDKK